MGVDNREWLARASNSDGEQTGQSDVAAVHSGPTNAVMTKLPYKSKVILAPITMAFSIARAGSLGSGELPPGLIMYCTSG
jgi:hypothetical protein